ncbi:zf-HC2 domain-containing protein [Saccharothrix texasensis]|uniref:Putative anti-sigma-YlaC factor YlaD n=1 Tax=Saccharothrix texasensis TaxID=103734 RepID=A0A3N1GXN9_9PSEU|nr:zf-HC2 domain-containing protein [Saccharothrix texasensis]ROP34919.1 putative anti-sigma-YlaC factor YlaD [Saccharothrix texasensis]
MDCQSCREALSARLDGETEPVPAADTDAHLAQCTACTHWQASAQALTRTIRVRPVGPEPDLVDAVLAAAPPRHTALTPRLALAAVAIVQLWLALAQLLAGATGGHGGHGLSTHLFNEGAAWNLALGIGLLVAAVNAHRAAGLLPTLGGFVAVLLVFSVSDLLDGTATATRVVSHLPLVAGLVLLYLVARAHREPTPGTPAKHEHDDLHHHDHSGDEAAPSPGVRHGKPRHLRPTAHHRRAA